MFDVLRDMMIEHIKSGKLYPRPTVECPECSEETRLCWGEKRRPYLRHIGINSDKKCKPGKQYLHTLVIDIFLEYLNQGRKVVYIRKCKLYSSEISINFQVENYQKEVSFQGCRFDIAGFIQDKISCGIEVYNKHRTSNISFRNSVEWVGLDVNDISRELHSGEKTEIYLKDIRETLCSKCSSKSIPKIEPIENKPIDEPIDKKLSLYEIEENTKQALKDEYLNIAKLLGYLSTEYSNESDKMNDIIHLGKYRKPYQKWNLSGTKNIDMLSDIIKNSRCLKCIKKYQVSLDCLFCYTCFREIKIKEHQEIPRIWVKAD